MADGQIQTEHGVRNGAADDRPLAELMRDLSQQSTELIRQEIELAKAELRAKGKSAGVGAGMFGAAGLIALFGVGALTTCLVLALATAMDAWLAALIVAVVYLAAAGVAALVGKGKVQEATPPAPEQAIASTKEDVQWTKQRAQAARK
ncbi:MAG: phage holin family protein [Solirubrobacteraceae bacterium]